MSETPEKDPFDEVFIAIDGAINALVMARIIVQNAAEAAANRPKPPEPPAEPGGCPHDWMGMPDGSEMCQRCGDQR